jgi:hypothetical protein
MTVSTADKIFLCIGLISFGGMIVHIGVSLHFAYAKMDLMLEHLKNSPLITKHKHLIQLGPRARLIALGAIIGLLTSPSTYIRTGWACAEDLENFPADLKRKLIVSHRTSMMFLLVMFGLAAYAKFGRG